MTAPAFQIVPAGKQVESYLSICRGVVKLNPQPRRTAKQIVADIAAQYGLTAEQLKSQTRIRGIAWPRQHAMWALKQTGRFSYPVIARAVGLKDHTTAIHACRAHEKRMGASA